MTNQTQEVSTIAQLEAKMVRFIQAGDEMKRLQGERELLKASIGKLVKDHAMDGHRTPTADNSKDIKVSSGLRRRVVLDVETLASDLGVSVSAVGKKDFLIKAVQEGKLTADQYASYYFEETVETTSIRTVKP